MATVTTVESRLTSPPQTTSNNLRDILDWLKEGDYVVIHNNYRSGRFFHANCRPQSCLDTSRVIYVNVSSLPGLLDQGEWDYYITEGGFDECHCHLREKTSDPNGLPHSYHFQL